MTNNTDEIKREERIEELKVIAKQFREEYQPSFTKVGNNIMTGIGLGDDNELILRVYLTTKLLKNTLPTEYKGAKIETQVIGVIKAL